MFLKTRKVKKSNYKKRACKAFSEYIRERDKYICFTCGKKGSEKDGVMQAGHLFSRTHNSTLFSELNTNCQCVGCNFLHELNFEIYRRAFIREYGEDAYEKLWLEHNSITKYTENDYKIIEKNYKDKLKKLKENL